MSLDTRRSWIERGHTELSIKRQCGLLDLNRSTVYYEPAGETAKNLVLMRLIDEQYTKCPFYGSRRMTAWLGREGHDVNRKRVQRLMRLMGIKAIYPKPRTTLADEQHEKHPYLLSGVKIERPNQVWSTDITYIPMATGFVYLVAIMDWYSRYVLAWELSNTLDTEFCIRALEEALQDNEPPEIFNSDQGCQFTSKAFTGRLKQSGIKISMDGRGRALDNVFIERLWRSLKYEEVYLKAYSNVPEAYHGIAAYLAFYNLDRLHQSLNYRTPKEVHYQSSQGLHSLN